MVEVAVAVAVTECQHGRNLLPIGSSLAPLPSCFPTTLSVVFKVLRQSGNKPFVNLTTGGWGNSAKTCGWKKRGKGWMAVDADGVGNSGALNTV